MAKKKKSVAPEPTWLLHSWWVIPCLAVLVYIPSITAGFTLDDVLIVEENTYIRSLDKIPSIWTSHYWAGKMDASDTGLYRPLTLTTYNLQYALTGESAPPFHILNIILHALVCLVLYRLVHTVFKDKVLAALTGLLFAIHPLHTEAVAGIVGRAELLAGLFILLASLAYHHGRKNQNTLSLVILLLSAFGAMASKEHGFMLPAILFLQELYYSQTWKNHQWGERSKWFAMGGVTIVAVIFWMYRGSITGPSVPHELWARHDDMTRMATSFRTVMENIGLHFFPLHLSADYWLGRVPFVGFGNPMVILSVLLILALCAWAHLFRKKWPVFAWGILFFFLTLLPVSNLLIAAGFIKAERVLYIPSFGLLVSISFLLLWLIRQERTKVIGLIVVALLGIGFTLRTWIRAGDWKSQYTLALATLKTDPDSPRFNTIMGLEMRAQDKRAEALHYFEQAVKSEEKHIPALVNLGTEYKSLGRLQEAAAILERALALDPNTLATYVNLMSVYRDLGAFDKNVIIAEKAVQRYPQSAPIMWNAANAHQLNGNLEKANELRARAKQLDPKIGG